MSKALVNLAKKEVQASLVHLENEEEQKELVKKYRAVGNDHFCVQQKGLPKDYFVNRKGDSLVSQKRGETP